MIRTLIKLIAVIGIVGPTVLACLGAWGINPWILAGAIFVYAVVLGVAAWRLEKRWRWSGVALCVAVLVLGMLVVYLTHRRMFVR